MNISIFFLVVLMGVDSVDFATVLDQAHTKAERTGNLTENFIAWVIEVAQK